MATTPTSIPRAPAARLSPLLLAVLTAAPLAAAPQEPDEVLATYELRGEPAVVTRTDVALEMAFHLRRQDRGREGVDMLVAGILTREAAKRKGLMPTTKEVQAFWDQLKAQLRAAGRDPMDFPAVRNTGEKQWLQDLSVQIAQERLVRSELGMDEDEAVSGDMLKLWLGEAREAADVQTDPDLLPIGTALRVGDTSMPLIDLGFLLLRTSEDFERDKYIRQVVYLNRLEALAADRGVEVTPSDLDRAIENRREQARTNPRFGGVPFEKVLEAQGLTIAALRELRTFRAHTLIDKLAEVEFPDAKLQQELEADREGVLERVGPRRRIGIIFARAREVPNALIPRDHDAAMAHLEKVRARIAEDGFAATASIESEHAPSKAQGGDVGWHRKQDDALPEPVLKAAFALRMAEVSVPIRCDDGCYLVTVLEKEPVPTDAELIRRMRLLRANELNEKLLGDSKLEIVVGKPKDGAEGGK